MGTVAWAGRKIGGALVVLWLVATAIFIAIRLIPGDPAEAIMGGPGSQASAEALAAARAEYALDQPLFAQYLLYLGKLLALDFGTSYSLKQPVAQVMGEVLPNTLWLSLLALAAAWLMALCFAAAATRSSRFASQLGSLMEIIAAAVPHFWLGAVLIMLFSSALGWLPAVDNGSAQGLVLPVLTLALPLAGFLTQLMRDSLGEAMGSQFALAARARGESRLKLFWRHGLRHAALPALGLTGWAFSSLLSGAVVVEAIFARPGLGRSLLSAVLARDIPMVTGIALFSALVYIVVMALAEGLERLINPAGGQR
ncbi:ABC transporter permease [Glutamicibacter halophytocola]|uniref:ABC transporter permease n=1 Tax=Glutamicibacter halophytocola TaxID=1933880 RepID=A0ABX5Y9P1_9MICC|nr:ABC transporter permease [Glutamicibacter halophytocola]QDY66383.1 ABC transporter permease [Glutamicibacter halophytocola]